MPDPVPGASSAFLSRVSKEVQMLAKDPPPGVSCSLSDDSNMSVLHAGIRGIDGSPFMGVDFELEIRLPKRYPFEPPNVRFLSPIFHPNIDEEGRICLDSLKMPPKGSWSPALNIGVILHSIRMLMAEPNVDDPLMPDIARLFVTNPSKWFDTARRNAMSIIDEHSSVAASKGTKKRALPSHSTSNNVESDRKHHEPKKIRRSLHKT